jgi:hypothetical protein
VVSITPWLLYPPTKSPWYPLDRVGNMKEFKLPEISWLYITESIIDLLSETLCKVVVMINTMMMIKGNEKVTIVVKQYKGKQRNSY